MSSHQGEPMAMSKSINSMQSGRFTCHVVFIFAYKVAVLFSDCYWVKIRVEWA